MQALICVAGVMAMLGIGYLLSTDRKRINRRTVVIAQADGREASQGS